MQPISITERSTSSLTRWRAAIVLAGAALLLAACGGSADAPPPPETAGAQCVAPSVTQQPADESVTTGQNASFSVVATGGAPLAYQWQRNGVNIAGATAASYTIAATTLDNGVAFRAVVSACDGSATSNAATLTVTGAAPVLTITPQPADTSVVAGTQASFTVGGTCSSGTLTIQWQRLGASVFADIAGATSTTYSFTAGASDTGAQFRANLACSGQSQAASSVATLTVTSPGAVTLGAVTVTGIRAQAPIGIVSAIDQATDGSYLFYGDLYVWRLAADLESISNVAGSGSSGNADGVGAAASFNGVRGMTHDASGNLWITDNSRIRRIAPDGTVTTVAGGAGGGFADGTGTAALFAGPGGIAYGPDGDLYVSDQNNNRVRRVTTAGVVTTYATGLIAPFGIAVAANNDVYVAEAQGNRVTRIVRSGNVAGAAQIVAGDGSSNLTNPADGPGASASLPGPNAMFLRGNTLYVRDLAGLMRTVDITTGVVGTFTGSRTLGPGYADGTPAQARLQTPGITGIANGSSGGLLLADGAALRVVDAAGTVTTIASGLVQTSTTSTPGLPSSTGVLEQLPLELRSRNITAVAVDPQGRIVLSEDTQTVRRIDTAGNVTLLAGLTKAPGSVDGVGTAAQMRNNGVIAIAPSGVIYVRDQTSIKRIDTSGLATTLTGSTAALGGGAVDGPPGTARFGFLAGLAVAPNGDVIVSDGYNAAIRRVDAAGNVTTFSGLMGQQGTADGAAGTARYDSPMDLAYAPDGTLYLNDNGKLRRIAADGSVMTTAVTGVVTVTVDPNGTVYVLKVDGLYAVSGTGSETLLIPVGSGLTYGNVAPTLGTGDGAMAMLATKQIVIVSSRRLNVVTLP
jgi:sugar lactone lactonase YvrE